MIVPVLVEEKTLGNAEGLWGALPGLNPEDSAVLVKAARLYQQGAWLAEAEPHLSWLLFVSAVETVAVHAWKEKDQNLLEDIRITSPSLASLVDRIRD